MIVRYLHLIFVLVLTLSSNLYAGGRGAGVLPMFDDGTVLVGRETRFSNKLRKNVQVWSDFGGAVDPKDKGDLAVTALREASEETAKTLKLTYSQVVNSPYTDHHHPSGGSYRMYYVRIPGKKPSLADFHNNARKLKWKSVEKSEWKYIPAQQLLNAVNAFPYTTICPGTNEEIFAPTRAGLRQHTAQSVFLNLINSVRNNPAPVAKTTLPKKTQDIVTAYHLSPQKKNELYNAYVRNCIPGKVIPDNYHITLGWVENVQPKDHSLLKKHLQKTAEQYYNSATFTVNSIKRYTVNRGTNGGLILAPKPNEVRKFQIINQRLYAELQKFNKEHRCNYKFHRDVEVLKFEPHITIANTSHIHQFGINRDQIIKDITVKIRTKPCEVLHPSIQIPLVKKPIPTPKNTQAKKIAPKASAKKKVIPTTRRSKGTVNKVQAVKSQKVMKNPPPRIRIAKKRISQKPTAKRGFRRK